MLSREDINLAIKLLKENEVVILPTDSIYGLSAIYDQKNEDLINKIKKSDANKKLIVLFSNINQIEDWVEINDKFKANLNSQAPITQIINSNKGLIALRLIKRKDVKEIIENVGPIFSTSVNYSNEPFLIKQEQLNNFNPQVKHVFWDGFLENKASKIVDLINNKVIRE